jgi:hypothetical protein
MAHEMAAHALGGKGTKKHLKEMHIFENHDGSYQVHKHSGKPGEEPTKEGTDGPDHVDHLHDHVEQHFGGKNADEEAMEEKIHPGIHQEVSEGE